MIVFVIKHFFFENRYANVKMFHSFIAVHLHNKFAVEFFVRTNISENLGKCVIFSLENT